MIKNIHYSDVIFIIVGSVLGFGVSFLLLLMALFVCFIIKSNKKDVEVSEIDLGNERLPYPGNDYSYYTIVGMIYRDLKKSDIGIHDSAVAIAERNNPYDAFAVGIYRNDSGVKKCVGYVPRDNNRRLHDYIINQYGGETMATYRIWIRGDKMYGIAYIKDDGMGFNDRY